MEVFTNRDWLTLSIFSNEGSLRKAKLHLGVISILINDFLPNELVLKRYLLESLEKCRRMRLYKVQASQLRVVIEVCI